MNSTLKKSLQQKLSDVRHQIATLRQQEAALELLISTGEAPVTPKAQKPAKSPPKGKDRAPRKAMHTAILSILSAGPALTNGQIREALRASKYPYRMSSESVRNVLQELKSGPSPQISSTETDGEVRYGIKSA